MSKILLQVFNFNVRICAAGSRGNRGCFCSRGKSELHRAAYRLTTGGSNSRESVTEKKTPNFFGKAEAVMFRLDKPYAEQN